MNQHGVAMIFIDSPQSGALVGSRSRRALIATITVETLMTRASIAGYQKDPRPGEGAGSQEGRDAPQIRSTERPAPHAPGRASSFEKDCGIGPDHPCVYRRIVRGSGKGTSDSALDLTEGQNRCSRAAT